MNLIKSVLVWIVGKLSYVCFSRNFYGEDRTQWLIEWRNDAPFRFKKNGPMMPCCRHCIIVCPPIYWRWIKRVRCFDLDANDPTCGWCESHG